MSELSLAEVNNVYFDVLKEIGNIGAGNATTAISTMLNLDFSGVGICDLPGR